MSTWITRMSCESPSPVASAILVQQSQKADVFRRCRSVLCCEVKFSEKRRFISCRRLNTLAQLETPVVALSFCLVSMGTHAMWGCSTEVLTPLCNPKPVRVISHCRKTAQYRRVQTSTRVRCNAQEVISAPANFLLDWVASQKGAVQPNVVVDRTASIAGRCLRAVREHEPDDVLLSVPLSAVFADLEVRCIVIDEPCKVCFQSPLQVESLPLHHYHYHCRLFTNTFDSEG